MKNLFAFLLLLSPFYALSQSNYYKGSVTTKDGEIKTGYINYHEWEENPKSIEFKTSLDDKMPQTFMPEALKCFAIDGYEQYNTYTGIISLNKTRFPDLSETRDTSTAYGNFFLELITLGKEVTLYSYADSLKTRYFIQEQQQQPFELIYHEYYDGSRDNVNTDNRFIGQLNYLISKYAPSNTKLSNKLNKLRYSDIDIIESIVNSINGNAKTPLKQNEHRTRFYVGAALNVNKAGFYGDNIYNIPDKPLTYAPRLSIGIDVFNNPNIQKFFFRLEASVSYLDANIKGTKYSEFAYDQFYTFKQYSLTIAPQLVWNIYNKDAFKVYIDGGLGVNFSAYSKNKIVIQQLPTITSIKPYDMDMVWINFPVQVGVVVNKKIELFASYTSSQSFTKYISFAIQNEIYSAGVHYLLGKSAKK